MSLLFGRALRAGYTRARFRGIRLFSEQLDPARFDPSKLAEDTTPAWKQAIKFQETQQLGSDDKGEDKGKDEEIEREELLKYNEKISDSKDLEKEVYYTFGTRKDLIDKDVPLASESKFPFNHLPVALLTLEDDKYVNLSNESRYNHLC